MPQLQPQFLELPTQATTRDGLEYDPSDDVWVFETASVIRRFYFNKIKNILSDELFLSFKKFFIHHLSNHHVSTSHLYMQILVSFISRLNITNMSEVKVSAIVSHINSDVPKHHKIYLPLLFKQLHELGLPGLELDAIRSLERIRAPKISHNYLTLSFDPIEGPYSEQESQNLHDEVDRVYGDELIDSKKYLLFLLCEVFGARPQQIIDLKIQDFLVKSRGEGVEYSLNIPRAKGKNRPRRSEFTERPLTPDFAHIIENWVDQVKDEFRALDDNTRYNLQELPFFPFWKRSKGVEPGFEYHSTYGSLNGHLKAVQKKIDVISERTGGKLNVTFYRSRRTLGTRMGANGASENEIAIVLDHSNTNSCKHYIQPGHELYWLMDKELSPYIDPLVQAFKGEVVERKNIFGTNQTYQEVRADDPRSGECGLCVRPSGCAIYGENDDPETLLTGLPFSCYRCWNFKAFDDLDIHEEHLAIMKKERDLHLRGYKQNGPATQPLIAMQFDVVIRAIEEVLSKILENDISTFDFGGAAYNA